MALLVVLTGLPVAGLTCALACALDHSSETHASTGSGHHSSDDEGGQPDCDTPSTPGDLQLRRGGSHDCGIHDGTIRQAVSVAALRADVALGSTAATFASMYAQVSPQSIADRESIYRRPPGTDPPPRPPLVLRI